MTLHHDSLGRLSIRLTVDDEAALAIRSAAAQLEGQAAHLDHCDRPQASEFTHAVIERLRFISDRVASGESIEQIPSRPYKVSEGLTLYVGGPMTGYDLWNFPAFHEAAERLRAAGYSAIDPAELDEADGFAAETKKEDLSPSMLRTFMARDLHLILMESDGVALLPGWEYSKGAAAEIAAAEAVGIPVKTVEQWIEEAA